MAQISLGNYISDMVFFTKYIFYETYEIKTCIARVQLLVYEQNSLKEKSRKIQKNRC